MTALYNGVRCGINFLPSSESALSNLAVYNPAEECDEMLSVSAKDKFSGSSVGLKYK